MIRARPSLGRARMTSPTTVASQPQGTPTWWSPRLRSFYAMLVMCIAVSVTYIPIASDEISPGTPTTLMGIDFMNIHVRRLRYAHEAMFGPQGYLPGW